MFDAREEAGKARECVLIWDKATAVGNYLLYRSSIEQGHS